MKSGEFEEAAAARREIEATYGPLPATEGTAFLDSLALAFGHEGPAAILARWRDADEGLAARATLRRLLRQGVFVRLLRAHRPDELASASPASLPALANVLAGRGELEGGARESRRLVREALLAGRTLYPDEFEDPRVLELLAEDLGPVWMASLGAIRRLWPVEAVSPETVAAFERVTTTDAADRLGVDVEHDEEHARRFWLCLCIAESPVCPADHLHEARRRMKRLHPALHAAYMRRAALTAG